MHDGIVVWLSIKKPCIASSTTGSKYAVASSGVDLKDFIKDWFPPNLLQPLSSMIINMPFDQFTTRTFISKQNILTL